MPRSPNAEAVLMGSVDGNRRNGAQLRQCGWERLCRQFLHVRQSALLRSAHTSQKTSFDVIPFYSQFVPVHSANCVKTYTVACRRVLSSVPL
jgi:hypothetical protein